MEREIEEALQRRSLSGLALLAMTPGRDASERLGGGVAPARLAQINQALLTVIRAGGSPPRRDSRQAGVYGFTDELICSPAEDLAYLFTMPDAAELAPAVEAAAEALLQRKDGGKAVLVSRALLASETMRERVASVLERHGDMRGAARLRKYREPGLLP